MSDRHEADDLWLRRMLNSPAILAAERAHCPPRLLATDLRHNPLLAGDEADELPPLDPTNLGDPRVNDLLEEDLELR